METEASVLRFHSSPFLVSFLSQIYPVHVFLFYFIKTHFNIILPHKPLFSKESVTAGISFVMHLSSSTAHTIKQNKENINLLKMK
jgi:hypothetical protein